MKKIIVFLTLFLTTYFVNAQSRSKCENLAANALYNSDYIKKMTKDWSQLIKENGGTGYGLQSNEADKGIYSFVMVQHYPDRDYNAVWLTVDVKNHVVYEENMADPALNKPFKLKKADWTKLKNCIN